VNTDQAFDFLKDAGVTEDISIQTVRRWLREKKITFEGRGSRKTGYILEDTNEALNLLKDAGVSETIGMQIVQRYLHEGKIHKLGTSEYIPNETSKRFLNHTPIDADKIIRQLKGKIKAQEEHLKEFEKLHQTSVNTLIQQRNKLRNEMVSLENEKSELQRENKKILKENIDLRNELLKLKDFVSNGTEKEADKTEAPPLAPISNNYRQKLGLPQTANYKTVLAGYKKLLKITHPDHGGSPAAFHYVKTDFDYFRNSLKEK
jgi:arsenate reductase-like glutaredoxin family protein